MLPRTASIVIIGGGAIGCSIAYHLGVRGVRDVVVLERATLGSGSTSKAAGGIRAQFGTEPEIAFSLEALNFFHRCQEELGVNAEFRQIGYLTLVTSAEDLAGFRERVALQQRHGVDVGIISAQDARELIPSLNVDDVLAAVHCPTDGYAGPYEVTMGYVARARERGIRFCEETTVTGIQLQGDRVVGVTTNRGRIAAPLVVNAAGPAAARVGRLAGVNLPVLARRRHIFVTEDFPEVAGPIPLTHDGASGFYFRKELGRVLMSPGDVEDVSSDFEVPLDWSKLEETVEKAIRRVPVLAQARVANGWAGLRPLTPDDHAILGELPSVRGCYVAVGFGGHGFQHSPPTGRHMAELLVEGRSSIDLSLFSPARFDGPGQGQGDDNGPLTD